MSECTSCMCILIIICSTVYSDSSESHTNNCDELPYSKLITSKQDSNGMPQPRKSPAYKV